MDLDIELKVDTVLTSSTTPLHHQCVCISWLPCTRLFCPPIAWPISLFGFVAVHDLLEDLVLLLQGLDQALLLVNLLGQLFFALF
jgi:hypothetical protein